MDLRVRLFVCEHPDGRVTAQALDLPSVTAFEPTRTAALAATRRGLEEYVGDADRASLARLTCPEGQELRALEVDLVPKGEVPQDPVPVTVSLLVTPQRHPRGIRYVVTAPRVDSFQLVVQNPAQVEPQAAAALARFTRKWPLASILEIDQAGEESLEEISVPVPEADAVSLLDRLDNTHDQENVLALCGIHLTSLARQGRLGTAARRDALVDQMVTVLGGDRLNSILLVGRAGVGKTALVHELAQRIARGEVPEALQGRQVWFVTANNLIAGMKYTGEWQGRTQKLISQARRLRPILFMADPNEILDAGRWSGSDNNMGRFLRPYLESGELTLICECAPEGVAAGMKQEPSFINAFRRIDVEETAEADTREIVQAAARRLEAEFKVTLQPDAIAAALDLTRRFLPYRAFPGKAVRFLEDLVRDARPASKPDAEPPRFGRAEAVAAFIHATGLPEVILSDEAPMRVAEVRRYFEERLLGQPDAVDAMVDLVILLKAGLHDPQKPLGSFFFVGPTGVGKTEMAKVLAEFLFGSRERLLRFDMSEYASADALPRLIGTGWKPDSEGELTRRVREQPFCVVLFDEIEKAHREVFDALLAVLGEGRLTDASGRTADFHNAIVVMTSNLGSARRDMQAVGFGQAIAADTETAARLRTHFVRETESFFRPEFFNRIGRLVVFRPLEREAMRRIARRELGKLLMREGIVRRNFLVEIDDPAIELLVRKGFHPLYGARPLQREIERAVILPLARLLVDEGVRPGHLLRFTAAGEDIRLRLVDGEDAAAAEAEEAEAAPAEPRLDPDLAAVARVIHELRSRCAAEEAQPAVQTLRGELSALLARTREPTFWDEPLAARESLSRIYHLERVLKRLEGLAERAAALEERSRALRGRRNRPAVGELARDAGRLEGQLSYLHLELAGTGAGRSPDQALLTVSPLGEEARPWAERLQRMYVAWAARKGYECRERSEGAVSLHLRGSSVLTILAGESGLHTLCCGRGADRHRHLAGVTVSPVPPLPESRELDGGRISHHEVEVNDSPARVVRIYHEGRQRYVRDPDTGIRADDLTAVLEQGEIDAFLVARLRPEPAEAPEEAFAAG